MEWGIENGIVTVAAFANGDASIYLISGGGFIGGGAHESIGSAAKRMVTAGVDCQPIAHPSFAHPLPERGGLNPGPLTRLGDTGQAVIAEYRRVSP